MMATSEQRKMSKSCSALMEDKKKKKKHKKDKKEKKHHKKHHHKSKSSKKDRDTRGDSLTKLNASACSLSLNDSGGSLISNSNNNNASMGSFGASATDFAFGESDFGENSAGSLVLKPSMPNALPDIDESNPYRTTYVTINPNDRAYKAAMAVRDGITGDGGGAGGPMPLPELDATDASWLYDGGSAELNNSLMNTIDDRIKEKLQAEGYDLASADADTSEQQHQESSSSKKHQSKKTKKKKSKAKLSPKLFDLLNRDPARKKERKRFAAAEYNARGYIEDCPELAKEEYEIDNCFFKDEYEDLPGDVITMYPLTMLCALGASLTTVQRCYEAFPEALLHNDGAYGTPLHYAAAFHGRADVIDYLGKQQDGAAAQQVNRDKRLPLHVAAYCCAPLETISSLIAVHPKALSVGDEDGNTPLHLACAEEADLEILEEMMDENAQALECQSKTGATPLHLAVFHEASLEIIDSMVATNVKSLSVPDSKGRLPLHMAASCDTDAEIIQLFLHKYPAGAEHRTHHGKTPYLAAKKAKRGRDVLSMLKTYDD